MHSPTDIEQVLEDSLEDFSISRSERKELKDLLNGIQGNASEQAKVRQLAFRLATKVIGEIGELAAMEWLQSVIKLLYSKESSVKSSAYFSPSEDSSFAKPRAHSTSVSLPSLTTALSIKSLMPTNAE